MKFYWTEDLALGIDILDTQHKAMIQQLNRLVEAVETDKNSDEVRNIINFLEDYVFQHFAQEEGIMKEYQYPEYEYHRELHADFIRDFALLRSQFLVSEVSSSLMEAFKNQVKNWIEEHLQKVDKALGTFIRSKELVEAE